MINGPVFGVELHRRMPCLVRVCQLRNCLFRSPTFRDCLQLNHLTWYCGHLFFQLKQLQLRGLLITYLLLAKLLVSTYSETVPNLSSYSTAIDQLKFASIMKYPQHCLSQAWVEWPCFSCGALKAVYSLFSPSCIILRVAARANLD